jgi:DSF synthase
MGAYSFLARTSGIVTAEKMISSGEIYSAKELFDMGIVQYLAPADEGLKSVEKFIRQHQRLGNGRRALQEVRQRYHPLDYQELADVTEIWADAAMRLEDKDLRMIDRLIKAQSAKLQEKRANYFLRAGQDRRFMVDGVSFPLVTWSGEITKVNRRKNQDRRLKNSCIASPWIGRGTHESAPLC